MSINYLEDWDDEDVYVPSHNRKLQKLKDRRSYELEKEKFKRPRPVKFSKALLNNEPLNA